MQARQQRARLGEIEMNPHLRQRVAFIAALAPDQNSANWPAISDAWGDLARESQGTGCERQVQSLYEPIQRKDARTLVRTIGALLHDG